MLALSASSSHFGRFSLRNDYAQVANMVARLGGLDGFGVQPLPVLHWGRPQ